MPSRDVSLTDELYSYVEQCVQSGHYDNASEVIRAVIRELKQSEEEDKAKVEALTAAIHEGDVAAEMRALIHQRAAQNAQTREAHTA